MKRFLSVLAIVALVCTMIAPMAVAEEQVTLRVTWWGSQTRHDLTMAAIAKFEEKYPNIKVEPEFTSWDGYWSKLATQVAGGLMPDVIQMDYQYLTQYAQSGVLADLTPYFESGAIDISNVAESVISSGSVGDKIFALSTGTNALATFYRKDVLDKAGVEMPMEPTLEELYAIAATVHEKTGRTQETLVGKDALRNLLRSYGLQLFNDAGDGLGFDDPSYIVKTWQDRLDAVAAGWCLDVGETTATTAFDAMVSDSWATWHWTNELAAYQNGSNCELELACWPVAADSTVSPAYFKPSMFWSVSEDSAVKDAAATFINFFTNDPDCFDIVGIDRAMPISSAMREHIAPTLDETSQKVSAYLDFLGQEGKTSPIMKPDAAASGEVEALLGQYFEAVQYGQVDDMTAWAQQFMDEANALLLKATQPSAE